MLRLELLDRFGGACVSFAVECRRPIDGLLAGRDLAVSADEEGRPATWLVAATPGHGLVRSALAGVRPSEWWRYDPSVAGAVRLADVLAGHPEALLPRAAFAPEGSEELALAYGTHVSHGPHLTPDEVRIRIREFELAEAASRKELSAARDALAAATAEHRQAHRAMARLVRGRLRVRAVLRMPGDG